MESENFTKEKETVRRVKIHHLFFYTNDILITDISCYVIPISTFLESSRTGTSQCHCQKSSCWFRGMRSACASAFTKLSLTLQNY